VRRALAGIAVGLVVALAVSVRTAIPLADPPRWLTASYSALIDGPWYVSEAAARTGAPAFAGADDPTGGVPPWYRRPIYTAYCEAVYRAAGGARPETLALPAALAGAALAAAAYGLLARAAGRGWALLAALFVGVDALATGWSRTAVPYTTVALGLAAACGLAGAAAARGGWGRAALGAAALALVAAAAWGLKAIALAALAPVAAILLSARTGEGAGRGRGRRAALAALALAVTAAAAGLLLRAQIADGLARLRLYAGDLGVAAVIRRVAHLPVASGAVRLAPVAVALAIASPAILFRAGRADRGAGVGAAERGSVALVVLGLAVMGALQAPDAPYLLVFWPGVLVLAALSLRAIARGGAQPLARPGLAAFAVVTPIAFVALDALVEALGRTPRGPRAVAAAIGWFGDPYYLDALRFGRTLAAAAAAGAGAAAIAAWRAHDRASPPAPGRGRPALAAALAILHLAWQGALTGSLLARPEGTLVAAREDLGAMLPSGAVLGEHFAHALADGRGVRARYFMVEPAQGDLLAEARAAGVTHLAAASDRWSALVRRRIAERAPGAEAGRAEVASLYIGDVRVRIGRAPGVPARSAFERGRTALDAGDLAAARLALEEAAEAHPEASLPRVHLALAEALAGDLERAARDDERALKAAPSSFPARVVRVLIEARRGDEHAALAAAREARSLSPSREVSRYVDDLAAALASGDEAALAGLRGVRAELLAKDLLR
jgi:hypothetical protein